MLGPTAGHWSVLESEIFVIFNIRTGSTDSEGAGDDFFPLRYSL